MSQNSGEEKSGRMPDGSAKTLPDLMAPGQVCLLPGALGAGMTAAAPSSKLDDSYWMLMSASVK